MSSFSPFDCAESDRSKWWARLDVDNRFYKEGCPIIDRFVGEYRWLSNFHLTDMPAKSTEHYYQAAKARNDQEGKIWKDMILSAKSPSETKKIGRKVPLRADWEDIKISVMQFALTKKFTGSYDLYKKLVDTKDAYLIEGNTWHDNTYGICIKQDCEKCNDKRGKNSLGLLLMELREILIFDVKCKSNNIDEEKLLLSKMLDETNSFYGSYKLDWE